MLKKIKCFIFGHTVKKAKVSGLPSCFEWTVTCDCGAKFSYHSPRLRLYGTEILNGWKP